MLGEYLQGAGNNTASVDLLGKNICVQCFIQSRWMAEGEGGCLTLGFKPTFSPSAALIRLHFLVLKMLTPSFSFLLVKIILDGELCFQRVLLANTYVLIFFILNCMSSMFDLVVASERLTLIEDKDMKNCVFPREDMLLMLLHR